MTNSLKIYFDGACLGGNLKGGTTLAIGVHILFNGERMINHEVAELLPVKGSNNIAEWSGIVKALQIAVRYKQWAIKRNRQLRINIYGDARIPIEQVNRICKIKRNTFIPYAKESWLLIDQLGSYLHGINWIAREYNKEADKLSKLPFK